MIDKKISISFVIILLVGLSLIFYSNSLNREIETPSATFVFDAVDILSPVDGNVAKITVSSGDRIKFGDIIAEINENSSNCSKDMRKIEKKATADYTDAALGYKDGAISKEEYDKELAEYKIVKNNGKCTGEKGSLKYLHAPQDGIVDVKISEGADVSKDTVVAVLKEHKEYIKAYVSPKYKKRIKAGRKAVISIVKYPEKSYTGEVIDVGSIDIYGLPVNVSINENLSDLNLSDGDYAVVKLLKK